MMTSIFSTRDAARASGLRSATSVLLLGALSAVLLGCQSNDPAPVVSANSPAAAPAPPAPQPLPAPAVSVGPKPAAFIDREIEGAWMMASGELGGKPFAIPGFVLTIKGDTYTAGGEPPNDRGSLVYHHRQSANAHAGLDVIGVDGPNKGKRIPAIYRLVDGKLEICYDLSQVARPAEFASPAGTMLFRVTYSRK